MKVTTKFVDVAAVISRKDSLNPLQRVRFAALLVSTLVVFSVFNPVKTHADIGATHDALVSEFASFNTPGVVDGRVEAIAIDGDTVYVGGSFTQIHNPLDEGNIINQPYLFAYSRSTGNIIQSFDPQLSNRVFALETTGDPEGGVFAGGTFGSLNGEFSRGRLAKIDINGDRVSGFTARPNSAVMTMVRHNDTLYIGGNFSTINHSGGTLTQIERLAAIDTTTGAVSPDLNLDFGGVIDNDPDDDVLVLQGVDDIDITSDGQLMVVVGNFETINGVNRPRLAMLELNGQARLSTWNTDVFDTECPSDLFPQYIRGIDIAPDDTYLIVGTNGFRRVGEPACDTIGRYEIDDLTNTDVEPTWVNFTGGDSVYEVVATDHAVYAGGHYRWLNNDTTDRGDRAGPGSIERRGLAALDPLNGLTLLNWRSDRNPRGVGVFAMISEEEGLYIGDDTDFLNGTEHRKLKFLPLSSNVISRPTAPSLPTSVVTTSGDQLIGIPFDGNTFGTPTTPQGSGLSETRGGVFTGGTLFYADNDSRIWSSVYSDGTFLPSSQVDLFGLTDNEWDIGNIGGMFFDYEKGRLYYTQRNDSRLFYRAFTPASPYFGNDRFIASVQGDVAWGDVRGMDVVDGFLYFVRTDNNLYRAQIQGAAVVSGTTTAIGGPGIDGRNWDDDADLLAFLSQGMSASVGNSQLEFESSGSSSFRRFQRFSFPVTAAEEVVLRLQWDDPGADVALFVRDEGDNLVALDNSTAGSPKFVIVPAGAGGTYTASVLIRSGSTPFILQVNPDEAPPEPLADFEFTSSGSDTDRSWQVFRFDVNAGESVESEVVWDDPSADVRVFLRDENNMQIVRDIDGLPAMLSATASASGRWSVGVSIRSGTVNYDVLVNTN